MKFCKLSHIVLWGFFSAITQQQNLNISLQLLYPTVWAQKLAAWNTFVVAVRTVFLKMKREKNYYSIPQKLVVGRKTFHIIFKHFFLKMFSKKKQQQQQTVVIWSKLLQKKNEEITFCDRLAVWIFKYFFRIMSKNLNQPRQWFRPQMRTAIFFRNQ